MNRVVTIKTTGNFDEALTEAFRLIRDGYTSGHNSSETGSFTFEVIEEIADDVGSITLENTKEVLKEF